MLKVLTRGNKKLDKSIFGFSITPVKSCLNCTACKTACYARKSYNQYPNVKKAWDRNFSMASTGHFQQFVIDQLSRARKCKSVRIHVSGDFFSQTYIDQWVNVARHFPAIQFYTYTKVSHMFDFSYMIEQPNINVIDSIAFDGGINFGDQERVDVLVANGYKLCPATIKGNTIICGRDCKICLTENKVCFKQH